MPKSVTPPAPAPAALNRPLAFAMASASALFLAFVGALGQFATRELSLLPALFFRFLASGLVILAVLRGEAWKTLRRISRLDILRVGSVLISQLCLFYGGGTAICLGADRGLRLDASVNCMCWPQLPGLDFLACSINRRNPSHIATCEIRRILGRFFISRSWQRRFSTGSCIGQCLMPKLFSAARSFFPRL